MIEGAGLALGGGLAMVALALPGGIHRIPEGHVGVYWRGGALLDRISGPGFHMLTPVRARALSCERVFARLSAITHLRPRRADA